LSPRIKIKIVCVPTNILFILLLSESFEYVLVSLAKSLQV